jgi:glycosyltransferase involved in cell wall biosynthesis
LDRVSSRLRESLGADVQEVVWKNGLRDPRTRHPIQPGSGDAFVTSELFSESERPGFTEWIASRPCLTAAIFHDAIPLKHPHITWPQSVARHPGYMKLLARFDRVLAVSQESRSDLLGFWRWQGIEQPPPVHVLTLGADFNNARRVTLRRDPRALLAMGVRCPHLLCLGIIEPRKNQSLLLDVCADLWSEGLWFELHVVGRVNPHFGKPVVARMKKLQFRRVGLLHFHEAASDAVVAERYVRTHVSVFPTLAEGCGLPLLESLWMGVPCVCSDLPVLREHASGGGCLLVTPDDRAAWKNTLRRILTDHAQYDALSLKALTRPLPTWQNAARTLLAALAPVGATSRP